MQYSIVLKNAIGFGAKSIKKISIMQIAASKLEISQIHKGTKFITRVTLKINDLEFHFII